MCLFHAENHLYGNRGTNVLVSAAPWSNVVMGAITYRWRLLPSLVGRDGGSGDRNVLEPRWMIWSVWVGRREEERSSIIIKQHCNNNTNNNNNHHHYYHQSIIISFSSHSSHHYCCLLLLSIVVSSRSSSI